MQIKYITPILLLVMLVFIIRLISINKELKDANSGYNQREQEHLKQIDNAKRSLAKSKVYRDSIVAINNNLHIRNENLFRSDSLKSIEIKNLNKFDNLNSKELTEEMIKRYEREAIHP